MEVGLDHHSYSSIALYPQGATFQVGYPGTNEILLAIAASVLREYRLGDHLLVAAGAAFTVEPGGNAPWRLNLPLRVGLVW